MSTPLEEILELAKRSKTPKIADDNLAAQPKFPDADIPEGTTEADSAPAPEKVPGADAQEWSDNEDMHAMGITVGPAGTVQHGAMKIGHVVAVPKASKSKKYVGIHHPSGAMTEAHPNRARAAMALMQYHTYMPKDHKDHQHVMMSNVEQVLELAASMGKVDKKTLRTPAEGVKKFGKVTFADPVNKKYPIDDEEHVRAALGYINKPHNASVYPLNGVTLAEVKERIEAAAKKLGIDVADDSK